jgi:hypothetical protein
VNRTLPGLLLAAALVGCGGNSAVTRPSWTKEQEAEINAKDRQTDDAEKGGSGTATSAKKRR